MLEQTFYGNTLESWGISLLIIIGALVLNKIIILLNKYVIQKITSKTKSRLDDILFRMLQAPVLFGVLLFAIWIAAKRLDLGYKVEHYIQLAYKLLVVINITWFIARLVNALIEEYWVPKAEDPNNKRLDTHLISILRRTILTVIWAVGIATALNYIGYPVGAILGGLGIGGVAFALAAQDTIKNIFGGITIFTDRPFRIGQRIKIDKFEGFVEDIGIRSTRIRTLDKRLVTIPNFKMVDAPIENVSEEPMHRMLIKIGLTYDTKPAKMNEALEILKSMPTTVAEIDEKEIVASFSEFSDFALVITFIYYIKKPHDLMQTPSKVNLEILDKFNKAGLNFAYPTQTVYLGKE